MCVCVGRSLSGVGHCMLGKGVLLCKGCAAVSYKTLCCCGDSCAAFAVQQSSLCAGRCVVLLAMCGRGVLLYRRGVSVCVCVCERESLCVLWVNMPVCECEQVRICVHTQSSICVCVLVL